MIAWYQSQCYNDTLGSVFVGVYVYCYVGYVMIFLYILANELIIN